MLVRRDRVLFSLPINISHSVCLLCFSKLVLLSFCMDLTTVPKSLPRCSYKRASSGFAFALHSRRWRGIVGFLGAVEGCWTGSGGVDRLVEGWSELPACAWGFLLENRAWLLRAAGSKRAVVGKRPARLVLVLCADFVAFRRPEVCLTLSHSQRYLSQEEEMRTLYRSTLGCKYALRRHIEWQMKIPKER